MDDNQNGTEVEKAVKENKPRGPMSEETKQKIREKMLGRVMSDEDRAKMVAAQKAYWETHEHPSRGKPLSEETKAKIRAAHAAKKAAKAEAEPKADPASE